MAFITLKIPTLVQHVTIDERPHYHLRPLFLQHPVATHRRYDFAISQFQKEVKHLFKGFALQRENADQLLWYLFNPIFEYNHVRLRFSLSRQFIDGLFTIVYFKLKGLTFVVLPGIENFMFIAEGEDLAPMDIYEQAGVVVKKLLREIKEDDGPAFLVDDYFSHKRDFVTIIDLNVNINYANFKFDQNNDSWFFTRLFDDTEFDGGIEVEKVGQDLNAFFPAQLKRAFYKEKQVELIYNLLFQQNITPFALIGPEGVGKHSLIHEAIYRYLDNHYSKVKGRKQQIWHIDPTRIIAGMSMVGMWQKRFEAILQYVRQPSELDKSPDKLLIDNPVALLRIGKSAQNNMTLSDVLKPYLEKRLVQLAIVATNEEWKVIQEKDRRFSDLFQVIRVSEPSIEDATQIVLKQRKVLERENNVTFTIQSLQQLFELQRNYLRRKALPGSIMKLMTQLAIKYRHRSVDVQQVRDEFRAFSGLEERIFGSDQLIEKDEVEKVLGQELVGQPQAVKNLAQVVHLVKAKMADKSKPISSFLFIGPTGVGKTQAAKVLNTFLMGKDSELIRFDMNEYINEDAVQRLIGDYYNPEGQLTGKVRYKNFGVILLDEIEKAHPKVHDLLLQVLDDGRLTDSLGRTVDFTNMIIIMTSNVGANRINETVQINTTPENEAAIYRRAVENRFRPEFINRIDEIVIFNPLELEHILRIARLQIKELLQRDGFVRRTTILNISQDALNWVAKRGFDSKMGGRALRRQIERDLTTLSAEQLIQTNNDNPIILNIRLREDQLFPFIQPLEFEEQLEEDWIPELPDERRGRSFYNRLLKRVEWLERLISEKEEFEEKPEVIDASDWQHFYFKDKIKASKEHLNTIMLGFRDPNYIQPPSTPLRIKPAPLQYRRDTKGQRENYKDRLFQIEALKEINEAYQFAQVQFDSLKTEFIDNYLQVCFLWLSAEGFLADEPEQITIHFKSMITGLGAWEIQYLIDQYESLLKGLDLQHHVNKKSQTIQVEGHSLEALFQGEMGIHLFYVAQRNPIPIRIVMQHDYEEEPYWDVSRVIRIYDGSNTLTDLRSGFTNAVNATVNEMKLFLFAGIEPETRKRVVPF